MSPRFLATLTFVPLIVAAPGCSKEPKLSLQPTEAKVQVQRWVPIGTAAAEAQRIMERHGFACASVTNGVLGASKGLDYLDCRRQEGGVVKQRWQATILLTQGRVSSIQVYTGKAAR